MRDYTAAINELNALGLSVECSINLGRDDGWGFGGHRLFLTHEAVNEYAANPVGYIAKQLGITRDEYLAWAEAEGCVACAGKTRAGRRCKNLVKGGNRIANPAEWVNLVRRGEYCVVHGGAG